jgi:hypothetical protein
VIDVSEADAISFYFFKSVTHSHLPTKTPTLCLEDDRNDKEGFYICGLSLTTTRIEWKMSSCGIYMGQIERISNRTKRSDFL